MQDSTDPYMKNALRAEIEALQQNYGTIKRYLSGEELDILEISGAVQGFREILNQISAQVMALYTLKGQRTKITWEPLLENVGNALENMKRRNSNPRTAIELAFNMSDPNAEQVMAYLEKLKTSLA
jgi:hypothetical protein